MRQFALGLFVGLAVAIGWMSIAAPELHAELGQCQFRPAEGNFFQSRYGKQNYLSPTCGQLAIADTVIGRYGYKVGVIATGQVQARDNVARVGDEDRSSPCYTTECLARFNGSGSMWGVSAAATARYRLGPLEVVPEIGVLFMQSSFHARATVIQCPGTVCEPGDFSEKTGIFSMPSPLIGVTLRIGNVYLGIEHVAPAEHRHSSVTDFSFTKIAAGIVIPLGGKE